MGHPDATADAHQLRKVQKTNDVQFQAIHDHYKQVTAGMVHRAQIAMTQLQDQTNSAMAHDRATQSAIDRRPHQSPCIPRRPERKMIFSKFDSFAIHTRTSPFSFRPN